MSSVKILLVDDSRGDMRLITEALKEVELGATYELFEAFDGIEALEKLGLRPSEEDTVKPHLIVLDLNMPRMDGREFLEVMKNHQEMQDIPVIVLTTSAAETDIYEAYRLRANCYVIKPIDMLEFIDTVQKLVDFWMSVVTLPETA